MQYLANIAAADGQQTLTINPPDFMQAHGLFVWKFLADTYPAAGSLTIEYQSVMDGEWRQLPNALEKPMTGQLSFTMFDTPAALRFTIDGISGGSGLKLIGWRSDDFGLLPHHFTDPSGRESRLQVDVAQTGFFTGHEFRTFMRVSIASGATQVVRVISPLNVIIFGLSLTLVDGHVELSTVVGGTPGGTFSTPLPAISRNTMTTVPAPVYAAQVAIATGGTHTGGTELDVLMVKVASASGQAASVGASEQDERGIPAGTYYFRLHNTGSGTAVGVLNARWEERPVLPIG